MERYIDSFTFYSNVEGLATLFDGEEVIKTTQVIIGSNLVVFKPSKLVTGDIRISILANMETSPKTITVVSNNFK
jgi:hypothetical protein